VWVLRNPAPEHPVRTERVPEAPPTQTGPESSDWRDVVRALVVVAAVVVSLAAGPAVADLSPDQQKLVDRYAKTLERSRDVTERRDAARSLGRIKAPEAVGPLTAALADSDASVRRQAADSLWRVGEVAAPAVDALRAVLDDPSPGVRVRAAAALEGLGVPEIELVEARIAGLEAEQLRDRILAARDLVGFVPGRPVAQVTELSGPLTARNTADQPNNIVPQQRQWRHALKEGKTLYTFPPHSVNVLRFQ